MEFIQKNVNQKIHPPSHISPRNENKLFVIFFFQVSKNKKVPPQKKKKKWAARSSCIQSLTPWDWTKLIQNVLKYLFSRIGGTLVPYRKRGRQSEEEVGRGRRRRGLYSSYTYWCLHNMLHTNICIKKNEYTDQHIVWSIKTSLFSFCGYKR